MTIGIALLGYGLAGRVFHAPLISAVPGLDIRTVVTSDPERQAAARADLPGAQVVTALDDALTDDVQLVVVANANIAHAPSTLAAIERGMHVVIDKPVARDASEAGRLRDAAAARGVQLHPFQNRRWDSDFLTLRELARTQPIGSIHRFESRIERIRPVPKGTWRDQGASEQAGGVLLDFGAHLVDQAVTLLGPVVSVDAHARAIRVPGEANDDVEIVLEHASGALSVIVGSQAAAFGEPRFTLLGHRGGIRIAASDTQEDALKAGRTPADPNWGAEPASATAEVRISTDDGTLTASTVPLAHGRWDVFYPAVLASITEAAAPPVPLDDAIESLRVLDAAAVSARTGERVRLDPPAAHTSAVR